MHQPSDNPEKLDRELNTPEEVVLRRNAISILRTATTQARDTEHGAPEIRVIPGETKNEEALAQDIDVDKNRTDTHAQEIPEAPEALQGSQSAKDNIDELEHLRELRRLGRIAQDLGTPAEQQQILRGLRRAG